MRRWHVVAFCLATVNVILLGCASTRSPGPSHGAPLTPVQPAGVLSAVDADVFNDHTLITIQSNTGIRYTVAREETPPRLLIDLPGHAIAPGVRPLDVNRGGVTTIRFHQGPDPTSGRVEIGLQRPMSHHLSLPLEGTLLVELRPEPEGSVGTEAAGDGSPRRRPRAAAPGSLLPISAGVKEVATLGRTEPGKAERATEFIGVGIEWQGNRTSVRLVGNGPILLYTNARQEHPSQLLLTFPELTTGLAGRGLFAPTPHLKHLAVRPPVPEGVSVEMLLSPGILPQVTRDGGQVLVELARPTRENHLPLIAATAGTPRVPATPEPAASSSRAAEPAPVYTGQRISLDFQQADIIDVLRLIAEVSGLNIITSPDVSGRVTTRMSNVPWDLALDMILKTHGLGKEQEGTVLRVAPLERLRKERDDELQARRSVEELEPPVTRTLQLNYARAEDLKDNMEKLLTKQGRLDIDKRTNTLIIKDVSATVEEVLTLVRRLDSQTRQVSIEARIVETRRDFLQQLGIRWGGFLAKDTGVKFPRRVALTGRQAAETPPGGNFVVDLPIPGPAAAIGFSLISNSSILDLELQALESSGRGRIVSNPKVVTLDNKEAIIESGVEVPFKTVSNQGTKVEFKDAKITLKVTPHVSPDDFVLLEIDAAKKEVDFINTAAEGQPTIVSRQSKTSILIKDGATAVIGGLFKGTTANSNRGIPGLMKVPYLGWLFKTDRDEDNTEDLLFFITPRIVRESGGARKR